MNSKIKLSIVTLMTTSMLFAYNKKSHHDKHHAFKLACLDVNYVIFTVRDTDNIFHGPEFGLHGDYVRCDGIGTSLDLKIMTSNMTSSDTSEASDPVPDMGYKNMSAYLAIGKDFSNKKSIKHSNNNSSKKHFLLGCVVGCEAEILDSKRQRDFSEDTFVKFDKSSVNVGMKVGFKSISSANTSMFLVDIMVLARCLGKVEAYDTGGGDTLYEFVRPFIMLNTKTLFKITDRTGLALNIEFRSKDVKYNTLYMASEPEASVTRDLWMFIFGASIVYVE